MNLYNIKELKPFGILIESRQRHTKISKIEIAELKLLFDKHQLVILRNFIGFTNKEEFSSYGDLWGKVNLWPFGKVLELIQQDSPKDHIFDHSYVPMHWDGMYRPEIPEYQIFQCIKAPSRLEGGRTVFANSINILKNASESQLKTWRLVTATYRRRMEFYNSVTSSALITGHPYKPYEVLRFNEPHFANQGQLVNPPQLEIRGISDDQVDAFYIGIKKALYAPENTYAHSWQDGDIVIADNFTLLHGREAFHQNSRRHIQRIQISSQKPYANPGLESYQ